MDSDMDPNNNIRSKIIDEDPACIYFHLLRYNSNVFKKTVPATITVLQWYALKEIILYVEIGNICLKYFSVILAYFLCEKMNVIRIRNQERCNKMNGSEVPKISGSCGSATIHLLKGSSCKKGWGCVWPGEPLEDCS
jgi:hypothetical protein